MRRKRLLRNLSIYTVSCLLIGFVIGIVVGQLTVEVDAMQKPITVEEPAIIIPETTTIIPETTVVSVGVCKLTGYCKENYPHICNDGDSTKTSTGTTPTVGRTVAVDPKVIPYGSKVTINGHTYIAEDCGGAIKGNKVDILFATHQEALEFGVQYAEVEYDKQ